MIDSKKINEVVSRIANKFNPERIILFGSYAQKRN
jgi:predicted nucleotidyltransferase